MKKMFEFTRVLLLTLVFAMFFSCANNDVDKVNVDNQFAVSLFSGTVKVGDLLGGIGPGLSEYIQVSENGRIYAYYADSVNNAVVATNILTGIQDVTFQTSGEFEIPEIPAISIPDIPEIPDVEIPDIEIPDIDIPGILDSLDIPDVPGIPDLPENPEIPEIPEISIDSVVVLTFNDFVSIPFEYDGYEINFVELKNGRLYLNLSTSLSQIKNVVLSTDNIRLGDGSSLELVLDFTQGQKQYIDLDLTNCIIAPENKNITFSAILSLDIPLDQGMEGGLYTIDLNGGIMDVEFKTIDGKINDFVFDFIGSHDFDFSIPNMSGALKIATPDFSIKYINTFGFKANGTIDSLYLSDSNGNITSLIKDGERVELFLHPTGESYDSISELDEKLVDEINILQGFNQLTFNGDIVLSCDDVTENMITDESHIDIIADLAIPLEFEMENLSYVNKFDFNLDFDSEENGETMQLGNVFDELEFKLVFNNTIPVQIRPQVYVLENGNVIDSLFDNKACIHGKFDNSIPEDILIVKVTGKKLENVQLADQLMLDITLSTEGERIVLNTNDYFDIRIGLKTKTSEINLSELNF
ncbi:MAG: hypothetical protein IKV80_04655 [Bacteroidales bacterium]|nr:hypothetical protein [Bacteroidales bacterium]